MFNLAVRDLKCVLFSNSGMSGKPLPVSITTKVTRKRLYRYVNYNE